MSYPPANGFNFRWHFIFYTISSLMFSLFVITQFADSVPYANEQRDRIIMSVSTGGLATFFCCLAVLGQKRWRRKGRG